ncbi:4'-phosphopantetheinyl transferase family protein [Paenibacillus sp. sgz500958]|uniref:4'-phosphopantetheinyl transferase family protein n=1 Tax=Paenibacillus sp. sgz500958 TaxID=3242475 RepID=UPI0036D3FC99
MEIISLRIPESIPSDVYQFLLTRIGEAKKTRILRYQQTQSAYQSLLGELLVRLVICQNTSMSNPEISFHVDQYGKPSLKNCPEFTFNISHSGHWVVMIWSSRQFALGIDVEQIKPMDLGIAERFFHKSEYLDLQSRQETEQMDYFAQLWTLKESYIKAEGKGLSIPLDTFSFRSCGNQIWHSPETRGYYFKTFRIDAGHYVSACSNADNLPETIKIMTYQDVCQFFYASVV